MRIGIIGAGNVGVGLGRRLAASGHDVMISFARTQEKVEKAARDIGMTARAGSPDEAARHGEVVIVATPWAATLDIVRQVAGALKGKIVWDTTNPIKADISGLEVGLTTSAGEEIAKAVPGARVVKAVPPFADVLASDTTMVSGKHPSVFVASDDPDARGVVLGLVGDIYADGVDAGPLSNARYTEPVGMLLVQLAYPQQFGSRVGTSFLREPASAEKKPAK